ncbi:hypothetical protein [Deinococcus sp. Leaf326]|uniref:hypothetical protein n=1 Tax=Deinococcus sp. Leaf326 TaxID=1736338 RepID=UPI0012E1BEA0|nr:hypothetical protein [Deinococcus sp. Leaf326]
MRGIAPFATFEGAVHDAQQGARFGPAAGVGSLVGFGDLASLASSATTSSATSALSWAWARAFAPRWVRGSRRA